MSAASVTKFLCIQSRLIFFMLDYLFLHEFPVNSIYTGTDGAKLMAVCVHLDSYSSSIIIISATFAICLFFSIASATKPAQLFQTCRSLFFSDTLEAVLIPRK